MRLAFLLAVAAVTLLSSGEAVSAVANTDESQVSTMTSPGQLLSAAVGHNDGKRSLRVHKVDNEERRYNVEKFNRLMNSQSYRNHRFGNWVNKGYTDRHVHNLLKVDSNPSYRRIFQYYQNYLQNFAPRLVSK
ncbi:hypothetical protein PHYPSEUDO_006578 [Phytophthora pseudosyringae]|uniref:RxLR effector protein n=1 Tax=Phytophthora pseudosyringae TaxID=221518 RepID=A0A8T1VIR5_9STRA|nr:hypothetical protein PHYPSEUDO_006578 [Phytophthora pseudosyringae]